MQSISKSVKQNFYKGGRVDQKWRIIIEKEYKRECFNNRIDICVCANKSIIVTSTTTLPPITTIIIILILLK